MKKLLSAILSVIFIITCFSTAVSSNTVSFSDEYTVMYAPDGRTLNVSVSNIELWQNVGWYTEPVTTLYAPDGRSVVVYSWQVAESLNVGWYTEPVTTIYAPDGRTAVVGSNDIQRWLNVGWFSEPVANSAPEVTYSSIIGSVNGVMYTTRYATFDPYSHQIEGCQLLPIPTSDDITLAEFCVYGDYIYYTVSEYGSAAYDIWLYRCKLDFTQPELICCGNIDFIGDMYVNIIRNNTGDMFSYNYLELNRNFTIDNGILYFDSYSSDEECLAVDLNTLELKAAYHPVYNIEHNGIYYTQYSEQLLFFRNFKIYDDNVFYSTGDGDLYMIRNGEPVYLASNAYLDGGYGNGYLYFTVYNYENNPYAHLHKINLSTGEITYLDTTQPVSGGGPYFCW